MLWPCLLFAEMEVSWLMCVVLFPLLCLHLITWGVLLLLWLA